MHEKRLKLIYFSTGGSEVKEFSLGWRNISLIFLGFLTVCLIFLFSGLMLFTDVFHDATNIDLKKRNVRLKTMLITIEEKVQNLESEVNNIERDEKDLRIFLDMTNYGEDTRKLGRGGQANPNSFYSKSEDEALRNATRITSILENLDSRMTFASKNRLEIMTKYNEKHDIYKRTPSIRPVDIGRITGRYGPRIHPTIGREQFHDGLDIAAPRGTPVYASADGTVEKVVFKYRPNQSYGREIVIDHLNGFKTRYAHLRNINFREGQKITRFMQIGTVGDTGRSTGPHLHYEVIENGVNKNPEYFIFE